LASRRDPCGEWAQQRAIRGRIQLIVSNGGEVDVALAAFLDPERRGQRRVPRPAARSCALPLLLEVGGEVRQ
jgi:hypothetical protein